MPVITSLPYTATVPGPHTLIQDLVAPKSYVGPLLAAAVDGVIFDGQGHSVAGAAGPSAYSVGVAGSDLQHITVRNMRISGVMHGIQIGNTGGWAGRSGGHILKDLDIEAFYIGAWVCGINSNLLRLRVNNVGGTPTGHPGYTRPIGIKIDVPVGVQTLVEGCSVYDMHQVVESIAIAVNAGSKTKVNIRGNLFANPGKALKTYCAWVDGNADSEVDFWDNNFANWDYGIVFAPPANGGYGGNSFWHVTNRYAGGHELKAAA